MMLAKRKNQKGFTLIEMLVSLGLFSVTVTMSMGTLLVLVDANAKSQTVQMSVSNLSFALDSMTRHIRTGVDYNCQSNISNITDGGGHIVTGTDNCAISGGYEAFAFTDTRTGWRHAYALDGNKIMRQIDQGPVKGDWQNVTADSVRIKDLRFIVTGTGAGQPQPMVTVFIEAESGSVSGLESTMQVQASVAQRRLKL